MDELEDFYTANARLGGVATLDVESMWAVFRLERTGHEFYVGLAERIDHPEAAELLRRNGTEELAHARRILKAIGLTPTGRPRRRRS